MDDFSQNELKTNTKWIPHKIALFYAFTSGLWILSSDQLLKIFTDDLKTLSYLQTFKGWVFVLITTIFIFVLITRYTRLFVKNEQNIITRKTLEKTISEVFQGVSAQTGLAFLNSLVQQLAKTLNVDYVLIGSLNPGQPDKVKTVALSIGGKISENIEYDLKGTPCENVICGSICSYETGIKGLFPEDEMLGDLGLDSYIGTPLYDSGGQVLGLLVAMDSNPLKDKKMAEALFSLFALRAAAEMERMKSEEELKKSEAKYREVFNNANDAIILSEFNLRESGKIIDVNDKFCQLFGKTRDEISGMTVAGINNYDLSTKSKAIRASLSSTGQATYEINYDTLEGKKIPIEVKTHLFEFENKQLLLSVGRDITERKEAEKRLNYLAFHDSLTELPNRMLFNNRLGVAIEKVSAKKQMLAILYLDLDDFKLVNDSLGHAIGDELLKGIAERLKGCLAEGDTVARMGGDEFTVILPDIKDEAEAARMAQKVIAALSQPNIFHGQEINITTSIGITIFPADGGDVEQLLKNADMAMYSAKAAGRNNYRFYSQEMNLATQERMSLELELRKAIKNNELELYYQPKVNAENGSLIGMEALIRWQHPEKGLLMPNYFIPMAETTGLIISMGEWVMMEACRQNKHWQEAGLAKIRIAVNISARQFYQDDFVLTVARVLEKTGLDPQWLELEITESIAILDIELAIKVLQELRDMGIYIAIDDFGTGYSALNYLKQFPINTLKIDRCFIKDIHSSPNDIAITNAIIAMGHSLNLEVIAEGVETEEQSLHLKQCQCNLMQGYLFGKPMPCIEFELILRKQSIT